MIRRKTPIYESNLQFKTKQDFIENGEKLFQKNCEAKHLPLFFPEVSSTVLEQLPLRPDLYNRHEDTCNKIIYNALKTLRQPVLVLHGITFNHNQFYMWDPKHDPEKCAKSDDIPNCSSDHNSTDMGKIDFLIIAPKCIVAIDTHPRNMIKPDTIKKKLSNQRTAFQLIDRIGKKDMCGNASDVSDQYKFFQTILLPPLDLDKALKNYNQMSELKLMRDTDYLDFNSWWDRNILAPSSNQGKLVYGDIDLIQKTMFALWSHRNDDVKVPFELHQPKVYENLFQQFSKKTLDCLTDGKEESFLEIAKMVFDIFSDNEQPEENEIKELAASVKFFWDDENFRKLFMTPNELLSSYRQTKIAKKMSSKKDYISVKNDVLETFSLACFGNNHPQMIPVCPNQSYIDLYPEDQKSQNLNDFTKQQDYEAEVEVYRALEKLKGENLTVIHGMKYSHYQFRMWESNHDPKNCSQKKEKPNCNKNVLHSDEGENDFVVLVPDYIVLIEVKNAEKEISTESMSGFIASAEKQIKKLITVIKGITDESSKTDETKVDNQETSEKKLESKSDSIRLYRYVAFPGINYQSNTGSCEIGCIFKSDLQEFAKWWQKEINDKTKWNFEEITGDINLLRNALRALWLTTGGKGHQADGKTSRSVQ